MIHIWVRPNARAALAPYAIAATQTEADTKISAIRLRAPRWEIHLMTSDDHPIPACRPTWEHQSKGA
jgi:hypothetical protein